MRIYMTEEQVSELTRQLAQACEQCSLSEADHVIRLAAENAVKAYRQWLQSDNGTD